MLANVRLQKLQSHMAELIGYFAATLIGVSLGLIGGGGSILTVPVLVYLMQVNPVLATAYSLFVVGATSLAGALSYFKKGLIHYKTAFVFALPSFIAVYLIRRYAIPAIPDPFISSDAMVLSKDMAIMVFFALIMLIAAVSMILTKPGQKSDHETLRYNYPLIALEGAMVGAVTGLVGAGGGFLIIPALVLLVRLPMKIAVGTSLLIIAAKSLIGFLGDLGQQPIEWGFLIIFTLLSLCGIVAGSWLSTKIAGIQLKKGFGWFVLLMAIYILIKELIL